MKKLLYLLPGLLYLVSCSEAPKEAEQTNEITEEVVVMEEANVYPYFAGAEFDKSAAISNDEFVAVLASFDGQPKEVMFTSEITENCKKKGCWMKVSPGDEDIRVSFKDYDFFVPLDSEGHSTTLNGTLYYDTLTVEQLRHYAMDANATQDSLDKITEPIITLSYEATGVYVD
tara:strand:- start:35810 stop:36328 length:519 start_codon:yes stop_codon:yes gene_type:complete